MDKYARGAQVQVVRLRAMEVLAVFAIALATALATGLGALPFVFTGAPDRSWLGTANGLAAGFMLGASAGLCYEGSRYGLERTALGIVAGVVFIFISRRTTTTAASFTWGARSVDARKALLIVGIMTLHSFAEGVGVVLRLASRRRSGS